MAASGRCCATGSGGDRPDLEGIDRFAGRPGDGPWGRDVIERSTSLQAFFAGQVR
jgi:hypothetical protein